MILHRARRDGNAASARVLAADTLTPLESRDPSAESGPVATAGLTMTIELDSWDRDWLSRAHTTAEYQRMCKELLERCAAYAAQVEQLKQQLRTEKVPQRTGSVAAAMMSAEEVWAGSVTVSEVSTITVRDECSYPSCTVPRHRSCAAEGRCSRLMDGKCYGPRAGGR